MRRLLPRRASRDEPTPLRRRIRFWGLLGIGAVLVVGAAWLLITALLAHRELTSVKAELPKLRAALSAGEFDRADTIAHDLATHAHRAHELTTGPAWWIAGGVPWLGEPAQTARTIAAQSDRLGDGVLPGVLELAGKLTAHSLRHGDQIDMAVLRSSAPVLARAADAAGNATAAIEATPRHTWLGSVDHARNQVGTELDKITDQLDGASRTVNVLLPMLGDSGTRRYFIGFENEAESRGLGGLPGAFAILTADHGKLTFTHFENDTALEGVQTDLNLGKDFQARYGQDNPTGKYVNSDISPHFPDAARIWAAMWQKKSGERVDGAFALDPTALSYLLKVTGPATLPTGEKVGAGNVVALTQKDVYARYPSDYTKQTRGANAARKKFLTEIAKAVSQRLINARDTTALVRAAAHAASERRLVIWSSDPKVQAQLVAADYAGVVQNTGTPYSGFVVVNAAGSKLDYYLDRSMTYRRTGCGASSTVTATLRLTNDAPRSGLPAYVTIRADGAPAGAKPGDNHLLVTYYASAGSQLRSVKVDGKSMIVATQPENGLVTATLDLELPVQSTRTITLTWREPAAHAPLTVLKQPLVRPIAVQVTGDRCAQ
jgi:hypothetical protein